MATSDCRRVLDGGAPTLCGHTGGQHRTLIGEAGDIRPCGQCRCGDYLPPTGVSYFEVDEPVWPGYFSPDDDRDGGHSDR